jgi:PilZ domain-containing protein
VQRLAEIETVTINLPGGRDFDCAVIAVAGATAALKPYGFAIAKLSGRIDGVLISFVHERRLIGLKGSLTREGQTLRFSAQDGINSSGRRSTRVPVELPVELRHLGRGEQAAGMTINIATEGVLLRSALVVETGDELGLTIALPTALETTGRVVRHADDLLAVEFAREAHAITGEFVIAEKLRVQPV